jgi:hypothetical protein
MSPDEIAVEACSLLLITPERRNDDSVLPGAPELAHRLGSTFSRDFMTSPQGNARSSVRPSLRALGPWFP